MGKKKHSSSRDKKDSKKYHDNSDCYDDIGRCAMDSFDPKLHAMLCGKIPFVSPRDQNSSKIVPFNQHANSKTSRANA